MRDRRIPPNGCRGAQRTPYSPEVFLRENRAAKHKKIIPSPFPKLPGAPSPAPLPKCNVFCPPITIKDGFIIEEIRGMPYITTGLPNGGRTQVFTFQYDCALMQARGLDFGK